MPRLVEVEVPWSVQPDRVDGVEKVEIGLVGVFHPVSCTEKYIRLREKS